MLLSNKEIEQLLDSNLVLDSLDVALTQNTEKSPKRYLGPGSIYQDQEGILHLKMYHTYESSEEITSELAKGFGGLGLTPGKFIEDHHYFSLEAKDMQGRVWREENVWVSGDISIPASGRIVKCKLRKITSASERPDQQEKTKAHLFIILPGEHKFPFNEVERNEQKISRSICKLNVSGESCEIRKRETHMELSSAIPNGQHADQYALLLLEALSIGIGGYLYPLAQIESEKNQIVICIYSKINSVDTGNLLKPFPIAQPQEAANLNDFVNKYMEKIKVPCSPLFGYWYRILGEATGELENRALVISTAIEGMLKEYYSNQGLPDSEFLSQVDAATPIIKSLCIGERARERILSSLGNAKSAAPKSALYEIARYGVFTDALVKLWVKLRNKSAHADQLRNSDEELQKFLDEIHGCLELFYVLLFLHIGYQGRYFEYSKKGWPVGAGISNTSLENFTKNIST